MATVHRALERGLEGFERMVALKRLLPHLAADASFIKSFVREAKLASLLNHDNIVHIFELGRVATQYFISMEYIDGRDIRRILRHARKVSGPPPIHVTVGLLLQLCDALDYAHGKADDDGVPLGLVHRDVSPSNVLVTTAGQVKVIDFGIAKAQSSQLRTQTGRVKGKLAYMAPEALAGKDLDARSDLFAAGVIAHELLTARPLFASKNEYQTLMKVQRGEVQPPSALNPQVPPGLDAIVLKALAHDPDDRFAGAADLRNALHGLRRQHGLATAQRDIAAWVDYAFRLEMPAGASGNTFDPPRAAEGSQRRPRARRDDDEAVELAWGGNEEANDGEPVVLEDVPDVSEKHLASSVNLDLDDLADDIPTPEPSHGRDSEPDARATVLSLPRARARQPSQLIPVQVPQVMRPGSARPVAGQSAAPASDAANVPSASMRSVMIPPRPRSVTIPPRVMPAASVPPRPGSATGAPPLSSRAGSPTGAPPLSSRAGSPGVPSLSPHVPLPTPTVPSLVSPVPASSQQIRPVRDAVPASSSPLPVLAQPPVRDTMTTERTPAFALEDLGLAGDTVPAMPAMQSSEPIVRFREPTTPPTITEVAIPSIPSLVSLAHAPPAGPLDGWGSAADGQRGPIDRPTLPSSALRGDEDLLFMPSDPATEPMHAPPAGTLADELHNPLRQMKNGRTDLRAEQRSQMITPATALFAEPDPELEARRSMTNLPQAAIARDAELPARAPRRSNALLIVALLALAGGAAALTYSLTRDREPDLAVPPPAPVERHAGATGTIHFTTIPADAQITVSGQPAHAGTPWDAQLPSGVHQVEIHKAGFKAWLTSIDVAGGERQNVQVELSPLGSAAAAGATLVVAANTAGLDVVLDGVVVARTPARLAVKPGMHTVALRRGPAELWKKGIDAGAGTIYELHPQLAIAASDTTPAAIDSAPAIDAGSAAATGAEPGGGSAEPAGASSAAIAPATPPPAPGAPPAGPISVAPDAVTRLSGPAPNLTGPDLPAALSAKLCIDATGAVASAELLTALPAATAAPILSALRRWRYKPYQLDGSPHAACFAVPLPAR